MKIEIRGAKERWELIKTRYDEFCYFVPYIYGAIKDSLKNSWKMAQIDRNGKAMRKFYKELDDETYKDVEKIQEKVNENRTRDYEFEDIEVVDLKDFTVTKRQLPAESTGITLMAYKGEEQGEIANIDDTQRAYIGNDHRYERYEFGSPNNATPCRAETFNTKVSRVNLFEDKGSTPEQDTPVSTTVTNTKVAEVLS